VMVRAIALTDAHTHGQDRYAPYRSIREERRSVWVEAPRVWRYSFSPPGGMPGA
jgi:hypothetical protein